MALWVEIDGQRRPAVEIAVERAIGRPVSWTCRVNIPPDIDTTEDLKQLAGALGRSTARLTAGHDGATFVTAARPIGARWSVAGRSLLDIDAHTTAAAGNKDVFTPRRRVHRVRNWRELVDAMKDVAAAVTGVRNHLERYPFPSEGHTSIIQDGQSDWEFLGNLVSQFARLEREPALARLAVIGGNSKSAATRARWVLNWAAGRGYEWYHDVAARRARPERASHFGLTFNSRRHFSTQSFPTGSAPAVVEQWRDRPFDVTAWERWLDRDVPLFIDSDERFVWKVTDRLVDAGQHGVVSWTTELESVPVDLAFESGLPQSAPSPWIGSGTVSKSPDRAPWIEVRLDGFESGADQLEARVTTPYSGTHNTKGLHFVPEEGTPVAVGWSGRLMDPPVLLANVRDAQTSFASPSLWIESTLTSQYAAIDCKSVGHVTVGSDLAMSITGAADVKSSDTMNLTADGCDVELRGGVFYTGSGA